MELKRRVITQKWITREDLRNNPDVLYVFGDNEERWGLGGQAKEMRGEPNAVGVATLQSPGMAWSEEDALRQCAVVDADMKRLFDHDGLIIWPADGIGTGLASLTTASPTTFAHIQHRLAELRDLDPTSL